MGPVDPRNPAVLIAWLVTLVAGGPSAARAEDPPAALTALPAGEEASPPRWVVRHEISLHAAGEEPGFRGPAAVSTDPFGHVFVADTGNHRVVQFDGTGRKVFEFGGYGWREGELSRPTDVCAREGFRLFVVDAGNERIQQYDIRDASAEGTVFPLSTGPGLSDATLVRPGRMDLDAEGRVYVSDELCHCIWIFTPTGALAAKLGGPGDAPTQFHAPAGVAVGNKGRVYVADAGNRRVQVFDSIGNWIAEWTGSAADPLIEPVGIDVGPDGRVWVADIGARCVRIFTPEGFPVFSFRGGTGAEGTAPEDDGGFLAPCDVDATEGGRVWVVDQERGTVEGYRVERVDAGAR